MAYITWYSNRYIELNFHFSWLMTLMFSVVKADYCSKLDCMHDCIFQGYRNGRCVYRECECEGKMVGLKTKYKTLVNINNVQDVYIYETMWLFHELYVIEIETKYGYTPRSEWTIS